MESFSIVLATEAHHYAKALPLIQAYLLHLNEDVSFQNPNAEMQDLQVAYGPPNGRLLLMCHGSKAVGCVAYKTIAPAVAEMKRLFVLPQFQGQQLGRQLAEAILGVAKDDGHHTMVLDTIERLAPALKLYKSLGFEPCAPYYHNPLAQVVYLEKTL
jgi:GNAT superfamily N-acetyltransferase